MKQYTVIFSFLLFLLSTSSCKEWLRTDSEDRIMEDALFSNEAGFYTALNGVYIGLLNTNLYGQKLTTSTFDILAQYYDTSKPLNTHVYRNLANYDYQTMKDAVKDIWSQAYTMIGNLNTILEHCETERDVLSDKSYHLIKGEALALRAMLHFEVFRIFGPIYKYEPGKVCIPYHKDTNKEVKPLLTATAIAESVLDDLKDAENLLKEVDPVITEGSVATDNVKGDNRFRYRGQRLNYYAVKALIARVYLYIDDTSNAGIYANQVIREAAVFFPFATREQVNGQAASGAVSQSSENRIFSSEILFGLYNSKRLTDTFDKLFSNKLEPKNVLRMTDTGAAQMYDEEGDLRTCQWQTMRDIEANDGRFFVKYGEVADLGNEYANLMPVLRMSEMYLIGAECDRKIDRLNELRAARKVSQLHTTIGLDAYIEDEYVREFIGEGQLFWYYKRRGATQLRRIYDPILDDMKVTISNYQFDLPDDEQKLRQ